LVKKKKDDNDDEDDDDDMQGQDCPSPNLETFIYFLPLPLQ